MTAVVADLRLIRFTLALRQPLVASYGTLSERRGVAVRAELADGTVGWGEATPIEGLSTTSLATTVAELDRWRSQVPRALAVARGATGPMLARSPHAWAAAAGALSDAAARSEGRSLRDLVRAETIGPVSTAATSVAVNALIGGPTPDSLAAAVDSARARGFRAVKLKVGARDEAADLDRIRSVCEVAGGLAVRLDANGAWSTEKASRLLDRLTGFGIDYIEEPSAGLDALAVLRQRSPVPIAVDESMRTMADLEQAMDAADVVVLKPQALGGLVEVASALRVLGGHRVIVTSFLDGAIGVLTAAHLAAATLPEEIHGLGTSELLESDFAGVTVIDGAIELGSNPGLGIDPSFGDVESS